MTEPKTKRELARELLREMFQNRRRIAIAEVYERGKEIDVSGRTLQRAKVELGIYEVHNGPQPAFWELGPPHTELEVEA